ncbi:hypothetical protein PV327_001354 [Microctonus hyperodae]|uniref:Flap endonuclease GEN n=1 Tax=Microctonus hyperodae TaxID=165561 RepID=A0AA39G988_MICHY|nr:hypothetical protein PV327_001354 [Microctonus hyperodae]
MGVTGLWNIVTPLSKVLTLSELRGKTIAIDLSCWIVDSQNVAPTDGCPKRYLRNIFFRTAGLLLNGILPVFVLEGTAPVLKHNVIRQRNNLRKNRKEKNTKSQQSTAKNGGRSNAFNATVKECEMMLQFMGLECIRAYGEAEAMCAYLNADGLVDGCITQDSDCFLYGAKTVYRNFTLNDRLGSGCAIEEYSLDKIQSIYKFGRNKMIALALLCGCDYDNGVPGVGKDGALKWLQTVDDKDILKIFKSWRSDKNFIPPTATSDKDNKGKLISNEYQIRKKCMAVDNFPNQELIDEFIVRKGSVPNQIKKWNKPDVILLIEFLNKKLKWKSDYTIEKVIPILTRWNVENLINIDLKLSIDTSSLIIPKRIKKIRNIQSISNYEIEWDICVEQMKLSDLIDNDDQCDNTTKSLSTIEPQVLVKKAYPELVRMFEEAKAASRKKPTRKRNARKIDNEHEKIDHYLKTKSIDVPEILSEIKSPDKLLKRKTRKKSISNSHTQNSPSQKNRRISTKFDSTVANIYETLGEEDFLTDVEEDALEMSLVVARLCESEASPEINQVKTPSPINIPESKNIKNFTTETTIVCINSDSDEFNDDIPYIPLDVRIKN